MLRSAGFLILTAFLLSLSVGVQARDEERPDFSLMEYGTGKTRSFEDILRSKVNVMVVTSTTCGSCISELKALDWIRARYKGDMAVTAVFIDRDGESRVFRYLDYYKFDLDMFLVDPGGAVPGRFQAPTVPTMIMFDRDGSERYRKVGFADGDESAVIEMAEEILYGKRATPGRTALSTDASPGAAVNAPAPKTKGCASTG